ncbi:MAG: arylesterase [Mesorhizobium sp.]|nr:arylesterase [Mesorhizobium sp.]
MAFKQVKRAIFTALICVVALTGQAAADTFRIVGFGDSLMAGYNLGPNEGFPQKLEAALKARGHDVAVANAGVSGDTTSGGLSRLDWSVPDGTDLVILELGANDMLRGLAPEITEQNLDAMMASLKKRGIGVVLAGMLAAPNLGPDYAAAFNGIYPKLAEKYDTPLIPFFLDGVAANPSLQLEDGLHPSAAGVDRMVEGALPVIEPLVR